jgi:hypothetical protein
MSRRKLLMLTKNTPAAAINVKAGPEDGLSEGEFIVYPSTFIKKPDSYGDIVAPTAFDRTIKEWLASGDVLPGLYGHRMDDPEFFVAGASDMGTDHHGWWVRGKFDLEMVRGKSTYRLVKGRRLNQLSFAYDVLDEGLVELDGGIKANELRDLTVYEFSFVPVGANQDTSVVAVKAMLETVTREIKAGRVLSAKNEGELRTAHESIGRVLEALDGTSDEEKANDAGPSRQSQQLESAQEKATAAAAAVAEAERELAAAREASQKSSVDPSALLNAITASLDVEFA